MDSQIVAVYCLCDDLLKGLHHPEDPQCRIFDAEIMTIALVAALHFSGNQAKANRFLYEQGYLSHLLSRSRFNRRLHRIADIFWTVFHVLGETWKDLNERSIYIMDSFPVAVCDNYRIRRCRIYQGEAYRGYQASKKRYYYGLKIHLLITEAGQPVEFMLTPGSFSDTPTLKAYLLDLPEGAQLTGDKAYNDYEVEDLLNELGIRFCPLRKQNSKRPLPPWVTYLMASYRKTVETTGSMVERILPKHIHAVTAAGFELKVALFVLACSVGYLG
jgi:Transposase DDE domain